MGTVANELGEAGREREHVNMCEKRNAQSTWMTRDGWWRQMPIGSGV